MYSALGCLRGSTGSTCIIALHTTNGTWERPADVSACYSYASSQGSSPHLPMDLESREHRDGVVDDELNDVDIMSVTKDRNTVRVIINRRAPVMLLDDVIPDSLSHVNHRR